MDLKIRQPGVNVCYYCLRDLYPQGEFAISLNTCPYCHRKVSSDLINLHASNTYAVVRRVIGALPHDEEARTEILGGHFIVRHGWEPYLEFIVTAILSGVIGNLSYDAIKYMARKTFESNYPDAQGIHVDSITQFVLNIVKDDKSPLDRASISVKSGGEDASEYTTNNEFALDAKQKQLEIEIRYGIYEEVLPQLLRSSTISPEDRKLLSELLGLQRGDE